MWMHTAGLPPACMPAGGRLALEAAVDALMRHYGSDGPLELLAYERAWHPLSFAYLQAACVKLMQVLLPHTIAGEHQAQTGCCGSCRHRVRCAPAEQIHVL